MNRKIVLYGAGNIGKTLWLKLKLAGYDAECFCDSDTKKWGSEYCGLPVLSGAEVKRRYPKGSFCICASILDPKALESSLVEDGVFDPEDFPGPGDGPVWDLLKRPERGSRHGELLDLVQRRMRRDIVFGDEYFDNRIKAFRRRTIPWLESIVPLAGARVLEIGCGTGAFTLCLAEQGARVTGIDIDEASVETARKLCGQYGFAAELRCMNAQDLSAFEPGSFDLVIYAACLEHMTCREQIASLGEGRRLLAPGQYMVVADVPNRLWYYDGHSALMNFYHWLPDETALSYARYSPREAQRALAEAGDRMKLIRFGRSISYHEFELAFCRQGDLPVVSTMSDFHGDWEHPYTAFLKLVCPPELPHGFLNAYLNLAMTWGEDQ